MQLKFLTAVFCLFWIMAFPALAHPIEPGSAEERTALSNFDDYLAEFREQNGIPALSAAILRDGKLLWEKAYGWSDDEGETASTVHTTYSIASVTKPIVAAAIISEAEEDRLDLGMSLAADGDWRDTCEWLSNSDILFGSGGEEADGTLVPPMDCSRDIKLRDMLNMRANGDGSTFVYNPISFARIDRVISGAGGRELRQIVREQVMDRAGIQNITLGWRDPEGGSALRLLALPFMLKDGRPIRTSISDDDFRASAGIKASVHQLAQFDMALDGGKLMPRVWHDRIFQAPIALDAGDYRWGWFVQNWKGHRLAWHSGWDPDRYSAMYLKVPQERLTLVVLANTEAIWWQNSLVRAEIEKSPIAARFLEEFLYYDQSDTSPNDLSSS